LLSLKSGANIQTLFLFASSFEKLFLLLKEVNFAFACGGPSLPRAFVCLLTKETKTAGGLFIGLIF
jgi:hypothetical protein